MAAITLNQPVHLDITLDDNAVLSDIKKALKMIRGVAAVKTVKPTKHNITKTEGYKEAMEDVKSGRIYHAESVDDMFKQILG